MNTFCKKGLAGVVLSVAVISGAYACTLKAPETVTYKVTAESGDTVWSLCQKVNRGHQDLSLLVWQTMQVNHIENPAALTPGKEISITVNKI